jgi:signal transduction histidine kinase
LAIAKAFVGAHGGGIWIDPATMHGARIVFTVPAAAPAAARRDQRVGT